MPDDGLRPRHAGSAMHLLGAVSLQAARGVFKRTGKAHRTEGCQRGMFCGEGSGFHSAESVGMSVPTNNPQRYVSILRLWVASILSETCQTVTAS